MYAQIIDDTVGNTLVAASTLQKDVKAELEKTNNVEAAACLGKVIAEKAKEKGITSSAYLIPLPLYCPFIHDIFSFSYFSKCIFSNFQYGDSSRKRY